MPEVQWYYARNDEQFGPVTGGELKQLAATGRLSPDDLLWREGMDAWTTAIHLAGLFDEGHLAPTTLPVVVADPVPPGPPLGGEAPRPPLTTAPKAASDSQSIVLRLTQSMLWAICVLVVLAGMVLFTRAFLAAKEPSEEAAAAAVYATFFIGAYVLARAGEKLSRLLADHSGEL